MTLTFPMFNFPNLKRMFCAPVERPTEPTPQVNSEGDNTQAERAFMQELMFNHPEAIQSDQGLMAMMTLYPRQF